MVGKDEFKNKINSVVEHIKNNDSANATSEIMKVIDDYNQGFDELETMNQKHQTLEDTNKDLNTKIEGLKNVNMDLLLKVGTPHKDTPTINKEEQEKDKLKFEDLFDEKGELK